MAHHFKTEKHFKNRHFIDQNKIHSKEKMAPLKPAEIPAIEEKAEQTRQGVEPAKQAHIKPAPVANDSPTAPLPVMAQRTFLFARKKTVWEKLNHKFQQLIHRIKSMHSLKRRQP